MEVNQPMSLPPNKRKQPESDHFVSDDDEEVRKRDAAEALMMISRDYFAQLGYISPEKTQIQGETKATEEKLKSQHNTPEKVKGQGESKVISQKRKTKSKGGMHQCKVCAVNFPSGQGLGGHMRRHYEGVIIKKKKVENKNDFNTDLKKKVENKIHILNIDLNEPVWEEGESSSMERDKEKIEENSSKDYEKDEEETTDNSHH